MKRRFFFGRKLDESNTNELAHAEWEPFRDWGGTLLTVHFDAQHSTVKLSSNAGTTASQNLNTFEFGASLSSQSTQDEYPVRTRIEPRLTWAPGVGANEPPFAHFVIAANRHRTFYQWEYDLAGRFEAATADTPIFEQPSLGGADVLRGFRADDAIGLRLWSLQSELWHPVPGLNASKISDQQIRSILNGLRIAPFFDAGGAYQTSGSQAGLRYGAGVGLRLDLKVAVMKFDWAYGLGNAASGGSRGKFYFSVGTNLPY